MLLHVHFLLHGHHHLLLHVLLLLLLVLHVAHLWHWGEATLSLIALHLLLLLLLRSARLEVKWVLLIWLLLLLLREATKLLEYLVADGLELFGGGRIRRVHEKQVHIEGGLSWRCLDGCGRLLHRLTVKVEVELVVNGLLFHFLPLGGLLTTPISVFDCGQLSKAMVKTCIEVEFFLLGSLLLSELLLNLSNLELVQLAETTIVTRTALLPHLLFLPILLQMIIHAKISARIQDAAYIARRRRVDFVQICTVVFGLVGVIFTSMIFPVKSLFVFGFLQKLRKMLLADLQVIPDIF